LIPASSFCWYNEGVECIGVTEQMNNPVDEFAKQLSSAPERPFDRMQVRRYAGVSFLNFLLKEGAAREDLETFIRKEAERFTENTAWSQEFVYVRTSHLGLIYRFRFRVPNEKSFCCGNLCPDCVRLNNI
jgi:hypothetical protein